MAKHELNRADIMPMEAYAAVRRERRRAITELKKNRRMAVGPDATFYFECYDTMWHQVHEMLHIERGGEDQIPDELSAYNPLIPKGGELVATLMFEIDDPVRRAQVLDRLGGVEESVTLNFEGEVVTGVAEEDIDRTTADGKASSVQFLHFPFTASQIETFRRPGTRVIVAISHPGYDHQAGMPEEVRAALAQDFD
ncbi:MAG: DUF3501 family protein [Rhodospirillales bacterium]|jgi:hypothetical protein|nr:DUF3501 family protein [Rhodospirillales bacterium]MDP6884236.1 DUF3501 family protein [Rhodospirillales bacterium]